jgi:hypothetical protein
LSKPLVTAESLRDLLDYAPETGRFFWKVSIGPTTPGLEAAKATVARGYRVIGVGGRTYYAHRLAWLHVHGRHPNGHIDHINGDKTDNRIANLRECSPGENIRNQPCRAACGFKGVHPNKKRWSAHIRVDNRKYHLGTFDTPEEAGAAYDEACLRLHGEFGRPNRRPVVPSAAAEEGERSAQHPASEASQQ